MNISKTGAIKQIIYCLIVFMILIDSAQINAQSLNLSKIAQYSFKTGKHSTYPIIPDQKALFVDDTKNIYFNLTTNEPGVSTGIVFGTIQDGIATLIDTADNVGFPDWLQAFFYDEDGNIHYSVSNFGGGYIRKISPNGDILWQAVFSGEFSRPELHLLSTDNHPLVLNRININDTLHLVLQKYNNSDGTLIWESEDLIEDGLSVSPQMIKEYDDYYQIFSSGGTHINLIKLDKSGNILSSIIKENPDNDAVFRHINMDENGNTYPGLNAWGYKCPKIDDQLDTVWFYEKPSPIGDEQGNRSTNFIIDENENVYFGGPFNFDSNGLSSLLLSKFDKDGVLQWQTSILDFKPDTSLFPINSFISEKRIWYSFWQTNPNQDKRNGALICYDLEGEILLFKEIEEFGPHGFANWIDFYENELIITGSSSPEPLSDSIYQHIIHYKIDTSTGTRNYPPSVQISPYPNPTSDWISIFELRDKQPSSFKVISMDGQQLESSVNLLPNGKVDLRALPLGMYIVRYEIGGKAYQGKVIKH